MLKVEEESRHTYQHTDTQKCHGYGDQLLLYGRQDDRSRSPMLVQSPPPPTTRHPCRGMHHHLETPLYRTHNPLKDGTDRHEGIHDKNESPPPGRRCGD